VHDAVVEYTGGKPQDDLTALAVRINAFSPAAPSTAVRDVRDAKKS
jgi:hypothetical protein